MGGTDPAGIGHRDFVWQGGFSLGDFESGSPVPALHEPTLLIHFGFDMLKSNVPVELAKQRDAITDQDGDAGDGHVTNKSSLQKALYGSATVDVYVTRATFG
jgi:hypothetical protein